jgi:hypothetical protein
MNRLTWNLRLGGPEVRRPPTEEQLAFGGGSRGPQVLPGMYKVKITVNDNTYEQPIEVKLDPSITTPVSELQETLDMQVKLRNMQSTINSSLRFLDSVKEQLKHTQTTMKNLQKEPDKDMTKALEDYIKQLDTLTDRLSARDEGLGLGGKSQVADDIGNLYFSLDTNFGPTKGQKQYFDEIQPVYRARVDEVNKFLGNTLPGWNENLKAWGAPTLTTRKPLEP